MTKQRAMELLMIERACVKRGSGMEGTWEMTNDGVRVRYEQVSPECDRNCAVCPLVQDSAELLQMYDLAIKVMSDEILKEESKTEEWRDWQRNCDPRADLVI